MANNLSVLDSAGAAKTVKTTDNTNVHTPHQNIDSLPALPAGNNNIGDVDVASIAAGDNNIGNVDVVTSALPTGASTLAEQQTQTASLSVLDDWDETDRAKVNVVVGQAGITAGAGAVAANTPRVTHASDDPVTAALQIIDDWDETDRAKVNPIVGQAGVAGGAGAVSALTQRVVIATDQTPVQVGGSYWEFVQTITNTAATYEEEDMFGASFTITGAARANGGYFQIEEVVLTDKESKNAPFDLVLFNASVALQGDELQFDADDTELLTTIGAISIAGYCTGSANSFAQGIGLPRTFKCGAATTSVFAVLVLRQNAIAWAGTTAIQLRIVGKWVS
jgi:hypothetical protein